MGEADMTEARRYEAQCVECGKCGGFLEVDRIAGWGLTRHYSCPVCKLGLIMADNEAEIYMRELRARQRAAALAAGVVKECKDVGHE
jgi:ribosomal protein S27AE